MGSGSHCSVKLTAKEMYEPGSQTIAHAGNSTSTGRVLVFTYFSMQSCDYLGNGIREGYKRYCCKSVYKVGKCKIKLSDIIFVCYRPYAPPSL